MANDHMLATVLSALSVGISGLSYLIALVYALAQLGRYPNAAKLLLIGVTIWLGSFVLSIVSNMVIPRYAGPDDMFLYMMIGNLIQTGLHAIGLCFVIAAAFTNRQSIRDTHPQEEFLSSEHVEVGPANGNPFNSPKSH